MVRPARSILTNLMHWPLPSPPSWLRRGPFRPGAFNPQGRTLRLTTHLGLLTGLAFGVCLITGLLSHAIQHPPSWFFWPAHPVWLYRLTQGLHVATGIAAIPLLAAKLWSVYPKLFTWPPFRDPAHALERASILLLTSTVLFELVTGLLNIARWYTPMPFGFVGAHYWTAWIAAGSIVVHVAVKLPIVRQALSPAPSAPVPAPAEGISRRGLITAVGGAVAAVTLATVGQTIRPLQTVSVLAPRRPDIGPQGLPVNTSAVAAAVVPEATDASYRLTIEGPARTVELSLADLEAMDLTTASLPIACVEGWSASGEWTGIPVRNLLALVGIVDGNATVSVESLQRRGAYTTSVLAAPHTRDGLSLLALRLNGEPLDIDHGFPCRLIAPNRPGVLQTKWVHRLRVIAS